MIQVGDLVASTAGHLGLVTRIEPDGYGGHGIYSVLWLGGALEGDTTQDYLGDLLVWKKNLQKKLDK
jgi:hypothetical protein